MKAYIAIRQAAEACLRIGKISATILRPWYVLGPGHRWPVVLQPVYRVFEQVPFTRDAALRLGLVTIDQMAQALAWAVDHPSSAWRIINVPQIRAERFEGDISHV